MELYIVKGREALGEYKEKLEILEVEEKHKSYIGCGRKISKTKINKLQQGLLEGEYNIFLIDKEHINEARKEIKEAVLLYHLKQLEKQKKAIEVIQNHKFTKEIKTIL